VERTRGGGVVLGLGERVGQGSADYGRSLSCQRRTLVRAGSSILGPYLLPVWAHPSMIACHGWRVLDGTPGRVEGRHAKTGAGAGGRSGEGGKGGWGGGNGNERDTDEGMAMGFWGVFNYDRDEGGGERGRKGWGGATIIGGRARWSRGGGGVGRGGERAGGGGRRESSPRLTQAIGKNSSYNVPDLLALRKGGFFASQEKGKQRSADFAGVTAKVPRRKTRESPCSHGDKN